MNYNKYISYLYLIFLFYLAERNVPLQFKFLNTNFLLEIKKKYDYPQRRYKNSNFNCLLFIFLIKFYFWLLNGSSIIKFNDTNLNHFEMFFVVPDISLSFHNHFS